MYEYDSPEYWANRNAPLGSAPTAQTPAPAVTAPVGFPAAPVAAPSQMTSQAPTSQQIAAAEQSARQSWMDGQSPDQSVFQTLFSTNSNGQVVRNSDGYVSQTNMGSIQNPNAQQYYAANPQEAFFLGSVGQGQFKDAGVRGTNLKLGQLTPDQWYRGYTSSFEKGWDQDTSNTYRWAGQPTAAAISPEMTTAIKDYVGQVLSGPYTDQQRAQMISAQAAKYGVTPEQIAAATGYDAATVNKYLALAGSPSATGSASTSSGASSSSTSTAAPKTGFNLSNVAGPSEWDVAGNQTVANQLTNLMASDNPLLQQARARAMQQSNARGLSNSSIAQTAGDAAAYDAMMEVARQDASTNATAAQTNTAAKNQFTTDANTFLRNGYMADFNLSANEWAARQAYVRQREAQREENAFNLAAMERENELNKGNTTSANAQSDKQGYINALNESRKNWAIQYKELMADPNMSPENKTSALTSLAASYNTQIKQYAGLLGWDFDKWDIEYTVDEPASAANKPVDTATNTHY